MNTNLKNYYEKLIYEKLEIRNIQSITFKEVLKEKKGLFGELYFVTIDFDKDKQQKIVIKREPDSMIFHGLGGAMSYFEREIFIYENVSKNFNFLPKCYFANYNQENKRFLLFMEDLSENVFVNYSNQDFISQKSILQAIVNQMVALHVSYFEKKSFFPPIFYKNKEEILKINNNVIPNIKRMAVFLRKNYPILVNEFRFELIKKLVQNSEKIYDFVDPFRNELETLIHGDLKIDNLCFKNLSNEYIPIFFDWQQAYFSICLVDLSYFLTSSLDINNHYDSYNYCIDYYIQLIREKNHKIKNLSTESLKEIFHINVLTQITALLYVFDAANMFESNYDNLEHRNWLIKFLENNFLWIEKNIEHINILKLI